MCARRPSVQNSERLISARSLSIIYTPYLRTYAANKPQSPFPRLLVHISDVCFTLCSLLSCARVARAPSTCRSRKRVARATSPACRAAAAGTVCGKDARSRERPPLRAQPPLRRAWPPQTLLRLAAAAAVAAAAVSSRPATNTKHTSPTRAAISWSAKHKAQLAFASICFRLFGVPYSDRLLFQLCARCAVAERARSDRS